MASRLGAGSTQKQTTSDAGAGAGAQQQLIDVPWKQNLFWLEVYAWLFYLLLALIVSFAAIPYLQALDIPLYFGWQAMVPVSYMSVVLFTGPPPFNMDQLHRARFKWRAVYSIITGLLSVGASLAFCIVQIVYAFSSECADDPSSFCQSHYAAFVFLLAMVLCQIAMVALAVITIVMSCYNVAKQ